MVSSEAEPIETISITRTPYPDGARLMLMRYRGVSLAGKTTLTRDEAARTWAALLLLLDRTQR